MNILLQKAVETESLSFDSSEKSKLFQADESEGDEGELQGDENDEDDEEEVDFDVEDSEENEEEDARELYNELKGKNKLLPLIDFIKWDDVQV